MTDFLLLFLAFACGGFVGFITASVLSVGRKDDAEFDGGFAANNPPPVRTVIWGGGVDDEARK